MQQKTIHFRQEHLPPIIADLVLNLGLDSNSWSISSCFSIQKAANAIRLGKSSTMQIQRLLNSS